MRRGITRRKFMEGATGAVVTGGIEAKPAPEKQPSKAAVGKLAARATVKVIRHGITEYATINAYSQGEPVYAFGYTYVYGASPDLPPDVRLQQGNSRPWRLYSPHLYWSALAGGPTSRPLRLHPP